jgi:serine/threonine-protein kinase RsbW
MRPIMMMRDGADQEAESARRCRFECGFTGEARQVGAARRAVARLLDGCPGAEEATLIASELAANAVLHSASGDGGEFTVRLERYADYLWIEVQDAGGPWRERARDGDDHPHGLDIVGALCGAGNWGVDELEVGRLVWARLDAPGAAEGPGVADEPGMADAPGLADAPGTVGRARP